MLGDRSSAVYSDSGTQQLLQVPEANQLRVGQRVVEVVDCREALLERRQLVGERSRRCVGALEARRVPRAARRNGSLAPKAHRHADRPARFGDQHGLRVRARQYGLVRPGHAGPVAVEHGRGRCPVPRCDRRLSVRTDGTGPSARRLAAAALAPPAMSRMRLADGEHSAARSGSCRSRRTTVGAGERARRNRRGRPGRRRSTRRSPGSGRRRRTGRCGRRSHAASRRNCSGLTSWNSSTNRWRNRQRCAAAKSGSRSRSPARRAGAGRRSRPGAAVRFSSS